MVNNAQVFEKSNSFYNEDPEQEGELEPSLTIETSEPGKKNAYQLT